MPKTVRRQSQDMPKMYLNPFRLVGPHDFILLFINPTWEGVQILGIEEGGWAKLAPPKKSMKELCQTPGCYIEV